MKNKTETKPTKNGKNIQPVRSAHSKAKKETSIDLIIAIGITLAIFAVFALLIATPGKAVGEIAYDGEVRRGNEQVFTYKCDKLKEGDTVKWFVDGQQVKSCTYDGTDPQFAFTPNTEGTAVVKVVSGKHKCNTVVEVKKPLLTISAKDVTVTYGDSMPELQYECCGLIDNDTLESLGCAPHCTTEGCTKNCGEWSIDIDEVACDSYDVQYNSAKLTVLPKELHTALFVKVYDQTTELNNPNITLVGVLDGDDVTASAESVCFETKNVGKQHISTENIRLQGESSKNYILCDDATGLVLPKRIDVKGMTVSDKTYDGTTKAQIAKLGTLCGVIEGDSVAIGSLEVTFGDANVGEQEVVVKDISLVGLDKDNYTIGNVEVNNATITSK